MYTIQRFVSVGKEEGEANEAGKSEKKVVFTSSAVQIWLAALKF